ncbi:MAG: DUF1697 domain-containing protein [Balneolaceae bacterium]|nr:DUF1697 domain-containing protein [Balneolaceae bacterium]
MNRYIALLRGINVGGYRKIKMDELRTIFESMNFKKVSTYIQSGNVVFDASPVKTKQLADQISNQIQTSFGHDVPVIIRTAEELKSVLEDLPFQEKSGWKVYFSFLPEHPSKNDLKKLTEHSGDIEHFKVADRTIYSLVDKTSDRKPNFSNGFIEKLVKMPCTTRNLRTVQELVKMAEASA